MLTDLDDMRVHIVIGLVLIGTSAAAQTAQEFPKTQIEKGAETFATYCSQCHGTRMEYPGGSFDLRTFPPDQRARFVNSVTKGKNNMPPWGDLFQTDDVEALWAYVMGGEKK
jgi:mono/diheme cytochrome c family protein